MDSQTTEIIGRNLLVSQLVRDGLEVARPERDRGVDLIAYLDLGESGEFTACPIQMKAATSASFGISRKYEKFSRLLIVHIWQVQDAATSETYAMSYDETVSVADELGWTSTSSWLDKGSYSTTSPSATLRGLLEPHRMEAGDWRKKVESIGS